MVLCCPSPKMHFKEKTIQLKLVLQQELIQKPNSHRRSQKGHWWGRTELGKTHSSTEMRNPGCTEVIGNFATDCKGAGFHTHALEHGFTEAGWGLMLTSTSSCKSRPEGMAVGSHMQNLARSASRSPAFLYRRTSSALFLPKSKDSYSSKSSAFFSENTRYYGSSSISLWNTHSSLILFRQVLQKQMPVLQNHMLNKCFETLLSVEHIALFFSDLSLSAMHVIMGKKSKKNEKKKEGAGEEEIEKSIAIDKFPHCYKC